MDDEITPQDVPEDEFMDSASAADDDTIDNEEQPEAPHVDLPEGARAADYAAERQDGAEETPPVERGQREG